MRINKQCLCKPFRRLRRCLNSLKETLIETKTTIPSHARGTTYLRKLASRLEQSDVLLDRHEKGVRPLFIHCTLIHSRFRRREKPLFFSNRPKKRFAAFHDLTTKHTNHNQAPNIPHIRKSTLKGGCTNSTQDAQQIWRGSENASRHT